MFYAGLAEKINDEMAARKLPKSFNNLIERTINIDRRIKKRVREHVAAVCSPDHTVHFPVTELAVLYNPNTTPLHQCPDQSQRWPDLLQPLDPYRQSWCRSDAPGSPRRSTAACSMKTSVCIVGVQAIEQLLYLPSKRQGSTVRGKLFLSPAKIKTAKPRQLTPVLLHLSGQTHSLAAFIDSGADTEFMNEQLASSLSIAFSDLQSPVQLRLLTITLFTRVPNALSRSKSPLSGSQDQHLAEPPYRLEHGYDSGLGSHLSNHLSACCCLSSHRFHHWPEGGGIPWPVVRAS